MKYKTIALLCVLALALALAGCGSGEETTMTGMVVSVDGTVITLVEMDSLEDMDFSSQRPAGSWGEGQERPSGSEDFTMPEGFDYENFNPENFQGQRPSGGMSGFDFSERMGEGTEYDLSKAHISVQIDGGKAGGSMSDITAGCFVTLTLNAKGEVTNVLVSSGSGFRFGE